MILNGLSLKEVLREFPNRPLPKVAIFDRDGVLYDTMQGHHDSWAAIYLKHYQVTLNPDEIFLEEGRPNDETIDRVSAKYGIPIPLEAEKKEMVLEKEAIFTTYDTDHLFSDTILMLDTVFATGQVPMIATGGYYEGIKEKLLVELEGRIDLAHMVTRVDYKKGKPNPEPYLRAMEIAGVKPEEAIVVENAPLGVRSAVEAGALVFAINTGVLSDQSLYDEGAVWVFDSHQEFIEAWSLIMAQWK